MKRRRFLQQTGSCLALATLSSMGLQANSQATNSRSFKKGYMMNTFPGEGKKLSLLDRFKLLKEAGFDGAEPPSHLDQKEVLAGCEATGLEIASVVCGQHTRSMSHPAPSVRKQGVDGLKQALRDAKAYGASSVLCVAGIVDESIGYADAYQRTQDAISECVPLAEELGVIIAVENVWNNFLLSPLEAARFVDSFQSKAVGWHFDVGNVMSIGWPEHWIQALGKRIASVHIKEFSRKKMQQDGLRKGFSVEYLEGDNDWPAIMKNFREIDYNGWLILEPACGECKTAMEPGDYLKKVSAQLDVILAK